jgi:hypothetical protein
MKYKRRIDHHIENLSPFVKNLQRAAYAEGFRAGAEAMRKKARQAVGQAWSLESANGTVSVDTTPIADEIYALPLPEMPE